MPGSGSFDSLVSPRVTSRKGGKGPAETLPDHYLAENQTQTPENVELFRAAQAGSVHGVRTAHGKGGKLQYWHRQADQKNACHIASENGHAGVVEYLLEAGVDVDCIVPTTKDTALLLATANGHVEIAKMLLLRAKADPQLANAYGNTPLHSAARIGNIELCRLLISAGAVVDAINNKGSSPLHMACLSSTADPAIAQLLLDGGAFIDARDDRGTTPVLAAAANNRLDLLHFFLAEGARLDSVDDKGQDGLDVATFHQLPRIIEFFKSLSFSAGGGRK